MAILTRNVCKLVPSAGLRYSKRTSSDEEDIGRLNNLANEWWDENGQLKMLHSMNQLRIKFVVCGLVNACRINEERCRSPEPLLNLRILDAGCGGGILTEPLARLGAMTTGVDAGKDLIRVAQLHAKKDPTLKGRLKYIHTTIEEHSEKNKEAYDAVVASEVIEHVSDKKRLVECCLASLKPGGSFFLTTPCKSFVSWFGSIILAEKVLHLLPDGTHEWDKFIAPKELESLLETHGCTTRLVHGMTFNPVTKQWSWGKLVPLTYALHGVKKKTLTTT